MQLLSTTSSPWAVMLELEKAESQWTPPFSRCLVRRCAPRWAQIAGCLTRFVGGVGLRVQTV